MLRENTDDHRLVKVARKVAETLAHWDIPHLIVGGGSGAGARLPALYN